MRTDIELLELLRQRAKDWHRPDPENDEDYNRWCFMHNDRIEYGLCGIILFMNHCRQESREITDLEAHRLDDLILNHRESIASNMLEHKPYSLWFFQKGALEPRLKFIDLIIEKLQNETTI